MLRNIKKIKLTNKINNLQVLHIGVNYYMEKGKNDSF